MLEQHQEKIDSFVSYALGGGLAAWAIERAHDLTILFGLLIVLVRLTYDIIRLWRFIVSNRP